MIYDAWTLLAYSLFPAVVVIDVSCSSHRSVGLLEVFVALLFTSTFLVRVNTFVE